ncbi:hypothetical protein OG422_05780 [Streptomyces sp. NBC_01525]|uniref:hypothetical protein n=1 Tax=Streptomyces sp. NBC_01525 TaxID=2903893 RepID=UPI0038645CAA
MAFFAVFFGAALGLFLIAVGPRAGGRLVITLAAWGALGWLALLTYRSLLHALTGA